MNLEADKKEKNEAQDLTDGEADNSKVGLSSLLSGTNKNVSPWLAVSFSLFIYPGAGQIMNRRPGKAVAFGLVFTAFAGLAFYYLVNGTLDFLVPELRPGAEQRVQALALWGLNASFSAAVSWGALAFVLYLWSALDAMLDSRRLREKQKKAEPSKVDNLK
ncbi:MAG: hypothetical protein ACI38Q_06785 [Candidatus Bruticola sp.]